MIIVMKPGSPDELVKAVEDRIAELGYKPHTIRGVARTVVAAVGREDKTPLTQLETMAGVEAVIPILKPFKLVSREAHPEPTRFDIRGVEVGGRRISLIAGPCSVEDEQQVMACARAAKDAGAQFLRGGAFKPRTSPYAFRGLKERGLEILQAARDATGLLIVTEVLNTSDIPVVAEAADVLQIGARNCQNYSLLEQVGATGKPVLLKRGMATTLSEFLMSAEYLLSKGNIRVMLCERGIRTFETATRFTLDLNAIPFLKSETHLPVFVDPSHGTGLWRLVGPMARAAIAAGCDGLMIEIHPNPDHALSDGPQSLKPEKLLGLMPDLQRVAEAVGRTMKG
ncbi:MAG: 3-deoxy-7-phosphoheptulonate synthase [Candidatus Sumerlaeota bacterium]|nr:3-deoxy-7-phosphoheptulonate synthase [Candidatus Sumerlaeota bacterium]